MELLSVLKELSNYAGATPVSFSRANAMLSCPYKWKLQYVDKVKAAPYADQESTDIGKFLHQVSEHIVLCSKAKASYNYSEGLYASSWDAVARGYSPVVVAKAAENMRVGAEAVTNNIFGLINKFMFKPTTEIRMGINKDGKIIQNIPWKSALWVGIMDLHLMSPKYRGTLIVDYKSHAKQEAYTEKEKLQIESYALLEFIREPGLNLVQTDVAYFSTGTFDNIGKFKKEDVPDLEKRFVNFLQQYLAKVELQEYQPTEGAHCKWCGYTAQCPLK